MLDEIKKMQGINHNEFDSTINNLIGSAKEDLKSIGIVDTLIEKEETLIRTAIITYVLSFMDVNYSELYTNSYQSQKDALRHYSEYLPNTESSEESDGI